MQDGLFSSAGAVLNWQTPDPAASHAVMDPGCPASQSFTWLTDTITGAWKNVPISMQMFCYL